MYRIRIRPFFLLCLLCGLLSSCLEDIDLDTGEQILNVYCVLKEGPEQELELSYIAPTGGTSSPVGEDVTITLFESGIPVGVFTRTSETKWRMDYTPEGGQTYRLEVKVPGVDPLTAETRYPRTGTLRHLKATWGNSSFGATGFKLDDAPEDQILWCYFANILEGPAFADYIATDHPHVDGRGETIYPFDASLPIYQSGTLSEHFCLGGSVFNHLFSDVPPLSHEKALRILHPVGFNRSLGNEKLLVYHDDSNPSIPTYELGSTSIFGIGGMTRSAMRADLVIESVSAEYDSYLSDYYYGQHDASDFTALVYSQNFYSNILNGIGIFGASFAYRHGTYGFQTKHSGF